MDKEAKKISVSLTFDQWAHVLLSLDDRREKRKGQIESAEHFMNTGANPKGWEKLKEDYEREYRNETELMEEINRQMKGKV